MEVITEMKFFKETKNTFVFEPKDEAAHFDKVYVRKDAFIGQQGSFEERVPKPPETLTLTLTW